MIRKLKLKFYTLYWSFQIKEFKIIKQKLIKWNWQPVSKFTTASNTLYKISFYILIIKKIFWIWLIMWKMIFKKQFRYYFDLISNRDHQTHYIIKLYNKNMFYHEYIKISYEIQYFSLRLIAQSNLEKRIFKEKIQFFKESSFCWRFCKDKEMRK
jgi:hypothetical protein